eukprot:snap_masked-scaffold_7-processed-gene-13.22-mRNA-1 protein AED:1.00 eAED:1.00 QI:0/-1/0/0/-1/1/1/0/451
MTEPVPKKTKTENNLRSAEKHRKSTCPFADIIAAISIYAYKKYCSARVVETYEKQSTVLASFILLDEDAAKIYPAKKERLLLDFITKKTEQEINEQMSNYFIKPDFPFRVCSLGVGTKFLSREQKTNADNYSFVDCHAEILAWKGLNYFIERNLDDTKLFFSSSDGRFALKSNWKLVLYSSSAPCGNSVVKRWAKGEKSKPVSEFSDKLFSFPISSHTKQHFQSLHQGQLTPLIKKEGKSEHTVSKNNDFPLGIDFPGNKNSMLDLFSWKHPFSFCCSAQICFWNMFGVSDAENMKKLNKQISLSAIVVGRKFSLPHLQRGLCCRAQDFSFLGSKFGMCNVDLNHPSLLCTRIKLDTSAIGQSDTASFESSLSTLVYATKTGFKEILIDGETGKPLETIELNQDRFCLENIIVEKKAFVVLGYMKMFEVLGPMSPNELKMRRKQKLAAVRR